MNIILKEGVNEKGYQEFYIIGIESYEDFDIVKEVFVNNNIEILEMLDGIYSRIGIFNENNITFKLIYHEDVGYYLHVVEQSESSNEYLRNLLAKMMPIIAKAFTDKS